MHTRNLIICKQLPKVNIFIIVLAFLFVNVCVSGGGIKFETKS